MATHSSIHDWEIPWTEEPGGLQSTGSQRVGHELGLKQQALHIQTPWQAHIVHEKERHKNLSCDVNGN